MNRKTGFRSNPAFHAPFFYKVLDFIEAWKRSEEYAAELFFKETLLFGLDKEEVLGLVRYYFKLSRLYDKNPVSFSKEAIAIAYRSYNCTIKINTKEKVSQYINYTYNNYTTIKITGYSISL